MMEERAYINGEVKRAIRNNFDEKRLCEKNYRSNESFLEACRKVFLSGN